MEAEEERKPTKGGREEGLGGDGEEGEGEGAGEKGEATS